MWLWRTEIYKWIRFLRLPSFSYLSSSPTGHILAGTFRKGFSIICSCFQGLLFPLGTQKKTKNQGSISWDDNNHSSVSVNHHILANAHSHMWSNICLFKYDVHEVGVIWYGHLPSEGPWRQNKEAQDVCSELYNSLAETGRNVFWFSLLYFAGHWLLCKSIDLLGVSFE